MEGRDRLAAFQEAYFEVLSTAADGEKAIADLLAHPDCADYRRVIAEWDPHMVGIAIALFRKWGMRERGEGC